MARAWHHTRQQEHTLVVTTFDFLAGAREKLSEGRAVLGFDRATGSSSSRVEKGTAPASLPVPPPFHGA